MPDVNLAFTIPAEHVVRGLNAFNALTHTDITISSRGSNDGPGGSDFSGIFHVRIPVKDDSDPETDKQFAKRFMRAIYKTLLEVYEQSLDTTRHDGEIAAVDPVSVNVPDNVIT